MEEEGSKDDTHMDEEGNKTDIKTKGTILRLKGTRGENDIQASEDKP
jgi:hypothetical protein